MLKFFIALSKVAVLLLHQEILLEGKASDDIPVNLSC